MRDKRIIRSINFPRGLYDWLRQLTKKEESTTRKQISFAVERHLDQVIEHLEKAGFSAVTEEDDRHMVRASIDVDVDARLDDAATRLGVDYASLALACLRCEHGFRYGDPGRQKLLRKIKANKRDAAANEGDGNE